MEQTKTELTVNLVSPWRIQNGKATAPAIIIREGVLCGSHGCILHPADTLQKAAESFNGVPVTLDHPVDENGRFVSALENKNFTIGKLVNARWDEPSKAITALLEVPLNNSKADRARNCKEVSVGVYTTQMEGTGQFNGKTFVAIAVENKPDHVAILTNTPGACSWEDGCGIRANAFEDDFEKMLPIQQPMEKPKPQTNTEDDFERMLPVGFTGCLDCD